MRAIYSVAREDGTFPTVGTEDRSVILAGEYKTWRGMLTYRILPLARRRNRPVQVELFKGDSVYGDPHTVMIVHPNGTVKTTALRL